MKMFMLRMSFLLPLLVSVIAAFHFWRRGFTQELVVLATWEVLITSYLAIYLNNRGHDREGRIFYVTNGPERDEVTRLWIDVAVLAIGVSILVLALFPPFFRS